MDNFENTSSDENSDFNYILQIFNTFYNYLNVLLNNKTKDNNYMSTINELYIKLNNNKSYINNIFTSNID
jgi:hypothetical protein